LLLPIEHERTRHDDEGWMGRTTGSLVLDAARLHRREHHHRLAEAHLVGEAAAESEPPQKIEPAERVALVVAQDAMKCRRWIDRGHTLEPCELDARAGERLVARYSRLGREPSIEQHR